MFDANERKRENYRTKINIHICSMYMHRHTYRETNASGMRKCFNGTLNIIKYVLQNDNECFHDSWLLQWNAMYKQTVTPRTGRERKRVRRRKQTLSLQIIFILFIKLLWHSIWVVSLTQWINNHFRIWPSKWNRSITLTLSFIICILSIHHD